ncbi:MAG TPA: GxxExxY protein, partial [Longimicrobiales bacterium]|nr:GxxExxY protein [Longimicrobiales bacterium]
MKDEAITRAIIGSAMRIHSALGPGLLESIYESVMFRDLTFNGFKVERQKRVKFEFEGMKFDDGLRIDLLVEDRVIIEIKNKKMI